MKKIFFLLCLLYSLSSKGQLPETVIYLFDVQKSVKGLTLSHPKIISKKKGYNNQPYFTMDGDYLFYVSAIDTVNIELYKVAMQKKKYKSKRITHTKEAEYSPKYTPDMEHISCVRVEQDRKTQHFYSYSLKGKKPINILPKLSSIGYYEWLNQNEVLSFELPEPFYLVKHHISLGRADTLATDIGRTFYHLRAKGKVVYVDKSDSNKWVIRTIASENLKTFNKKMNVPNPLLTETLPHEEDYCFTQDGSILMGHEGILYIKKNPFRNANATWDEVIDLKTFGIEKFYRIAMSVDNTKLAVVAYTGKKP
ncbi:MAG TPA: hypothetical protein PKC41_08395 [Chitinophagaceae bacterium]|nr:hypothetical protein [Chitinophagaceae bacterium]